MRSSIPIQYRASCTYLRVAAYPSIPHILSGARDACVELMKLTIVFAQGMKLLTVFAQGVNLIDFFTERMKLTHRFR
eukprot:2339994-Rhodomonas_salina.2